MARPDVTGNRGRATRGGYPGSAPKSPHSATRKGANLQSSGGVVHSRRADGATRCGLSWPSLALTDRTVDCLTCLSVIQGISRPRRLWMHWTTEEEANSAHRSISPLEAYGYGAEAIELGLRAGTLLLLETLGVEIIGKPWSRCSFCGKPRRLRVDRRHYRGRHSCPALRKLRN